MPRYVTLLAILIAMLVTCLACGQEGVIAPNQVAIDRVANGETKEARASWWGFNPADATASLQAAINSRVPKLIVDNMTVPWIVEPIALASNQEIVFEEGCEVLARRGSFKGGNDSLFSAALQENISLCGYGATLRMWRDDYAGPDYTKAEWRHVLQFKSCTNVKVLGLTLTESGGDGIYLGTAKKGVTNKGVLIKDVICDRNYRQGISVITAEDLLIQNTIMRDTDGTAPRAGIDFEPNNPDERLVNCVMRDCVAENNAGCGYALYLPPMKAISAPLSMVFENCSTTGDAVGIAVYTGNTPDDAVLGSISFKDCTVEGSRNAGISVTGKPVGGCSLIFDNCRVIDTAVTTPLQAPIVLAARQGSSEQIGGIEFRNCTVKDELDRKPLRFADNSGGIGLEKVSGTLSLERGGEKSQVTLTDALLAEWWPHAALKPIPRFDMSKASFRRFADSVAPEKTSLRSVLLRRIGRFALVARQGEEVSFTVNYQQVARYAGKPMPVIVTGPSGEVVHRGEAAFQAETPITFAAPETGLYRIQADPEGNYMSIVANSAPINIIGESEPVHFYHYRSKVYFWVPAGVEEFGVRLFGEGLGEGVKATLINPAGETVKEQDNITQTIQFEIELAEPSAGEAWCIAMDKPTDVAQEDHYVDLRGVPQLLAPSPEALIVPVQ